MCTLPLIRICVALVGAFAGAVILAIGIGYYHAQTDLDELFNDAGINQPIFAIITLGGIIFFMSLISLLSAVRNTIIGKIVYCGFLAMLISLLVLIAIMVFIKHVEFRDLSGQMFDRIWQNREKASASKYLDKVNMYFRCCGSKSPTDYGDELPLSCCKQLQNNLCNVGDAYLNGCRKEVVDYTVSKADFIGSIAIIMAVVLSIVVISSVF